MKLETNIQLDEFYNLCSLCNDDIEFIVLLIQFIRIKKPLVAVTNDLQLYRFKKYENELNLILDILSVQTIKNLYKLHLEIEKTNIAEVQDEKNQTKSQNK